MKEKDVSHLLWNDSLLGKRVKPRMQLRLFFCRD